MPISLSSSCDRPSILNSQGEMQMLGILETFTLLFGIAFLLGFLSRDFQAILNSAQPKTDDVATETPKASPEVSTSPGEIPSS
jgi:hypothetical protein